MGAAVTDLHTQTAEQDPRSADELAADITAEMTPLPPLTQTDGYAALSELVRRAAALEAAEKTAFDLSTLVKVERGWREAVEKERDELRESEAEWQRRGDRAVAAEKERDGLEGERNRMVRALDVLGEDWAYEKTRRVAAEARVTQLEAALQDARASILAVNAARFDSTRGQNALHGIHRIDAALAGDTETPT